MERMYYIWNYKYSICSFVHEIEVQEFQARQDLLLRIVTHTACVQEYGIGILQLLAHFITGHAHDGGHDLAVGHVHLASVCFYEEFLHVFISIKGRCALGRPPLMVVGLSGFEPEQRRPKCLVLPLHHSPILYKS